MCEVIVQSRLCLAQRVPPVHRGHTHPRTFLPFLPKCLVCAVARVAVLSLCPIFDLCVLGL